MSKNLIKRVLALVIFVVLVFSLVSCTKDAYAPVGMKRITNKDIVDYTMYVPVEWTEDISTGIVTAYYSEKDRSNISVMAFDLDGDNLNMTVDEYWTDYKEDFIATFSDLAFEAEGEATLVDKIAAKKYVYTATVTGVQYKFMQVVTITNGTVYVFTYTSTPDYYDSHLEDVNEILSYIEFNH